MAKKKKIQFSLVYRDMFQSSGKFQPRKDQLARIAPVIIEMGCFSRVETNGGAFEQVNLLAGENPNEAVRTFCKPFNEAGILTHMLDRGLNALRMYPVPDDVRKLMYKVKKKQGTDITRIFCGLNDVRNIIPSIQYAKEGGMIPQATLCITNSPIHTAEYYSRIADQLIEAGAPEICLKDMAGIGQPAMLGRLTAMIKKNHPEVIIQYHGHSGPGLSMASILEVCNNGADIIDTAISPFALGTSQPATEVMVEAFRDTEFDTGLDQNLLAEISEYFQPLREEALASGLLNTKVLGVNIKTLMYQVPGGMLSNMVSQLKEQGAEDKYEEVLQEIPRVRKDLGEPPLVTPSSQIVGTQAVFNVLMGERYKVATEQTKDILLGKYGQTVKPFNPEVVDKVLGADKDKAITCRPADLLEPGLAKFEEEMKQWKQQDEDVLTYALFPKVAKEFFEYREAQQTKVDPAKADKENGAYPV